MNRVYTGYRDYFLFVRKLNNGKYVVDSKDKAFVEYYIGDTGYNSYNEAVRRIDEIKKQHKLDRFNVSK
jgi:hypothetical protein